MNIKNNNSSFSNKKNSFSGISISNIVLLLKVKNYFVFVKKKNKNFVCFALKTHLKEKIFDIIRIMERYF